MAESSNLITALGAGSGVDIKALAQGLVDAEKVPRQNAIQAKLDKSEAKISGYSAMMAAIDVFKASVEQVDSTTDFASTTARVSNASALSVSTSSLAAPGSHSISINSLAQAQRSNSDTGFDNITSQVNGVLPSTLPSPWAQSVARPPPRLASTRPAPICLLWPAPSTYRMLA